MPALRIRRRSRHPPPRLHPRLRRRPQRSQRLQLRPPQRLAPSRPFRRPHALDSPIALSANAALILGAGVLLGLLLGALLMRQWLLRRKRLADEDDAPPTLYRRQQPVDTGTGGVQTEAAPEFRFAARLYPGETTIALAPRPDDEAVCDRAVERPTWRNDIKLRAPIEVTGDDVERALFEQSMDEPAVARVFDRLRGVASERAAEELNRALEVDIFEVLAQGWARVPAVRNAVQLSALTQGPPALVNLDQHDIASKSRRRARQQRGAKCAAAAGADA